MANPAAASPSNISITNGQSAIGTGKNGNAVESAPINGHLVAMSPVVAYVDNVLSVEECRHIIELAQGQMRRAVVSRADKAETSDGRTGSNTWLKHDVDDIALGIANRISGIVGVPLTNAESFQVISYGINQEYRPHFDAYDLATPTGQRCCKKGGQRLVTALVYLNDVPAGGATTFPNLGVEVKAKPGRLAIFQNTLPGTTKRHPKSLHAGAPVKAGEKWAFNLWFRARPMSEIQNFDTD